MTATTDAEHDEHIIDAAAAASGARDPGRAHVLAICCVCLVLVVVAVSSLNIAIPELQRGLGASATELLWIVDVYALVFAGVLLPAGALGDRYGHKGALLAGLGLFAVGGLLAGLSDGSVQVVAGRVVMGVGAGFVMPATLSIITTVFPPAERPRAIAVWAGLAGAGGALGPVTSGVVLEVWDWSAVFFITVPLAAAAALLVGLRVPTSRDVRRTGLDPVGAALSLLGLLALLFGTIQGPEDGWTSPPVLAVFGAAVGLLAAFVWWELRARHPMLDPRLFRIRAFAWGSATITLVFFAAFGMFFLISQYLQYVKGYTPLAAGMAMVPSGLTLIAVAPRAPAVASRLGAERSIALGLATAAAGFGILSLLGPHSPYVWVAVALILVAAGSGLAMPPSTAAIVGSLPPGKAGVGSAVNDVTREVGGALGIAALGSMVSALYRSDVAAIARSLPGPVRRAVEESVGRAVAAAGAGGPVLDAARDSFTTAANRAFLVTAVLLTAGSGAYVRLARARRAAAGEDGAVGAGAAADQEGLEAATAVTCAR